jgi:hypothetical protein
MSWRQIGSAPTKQQVVKSPFVARLTFRGGIWCRDILPKGNQTNDILVKIAKGYESSNKCHRGIIVAKNRNKIQTTAVA